ncbi:MAG: methyltransferase domain-containing protein [Candidatus Altiarchaeota archaeon]|nr:methyltransferase domain-containing protein [Candidatus Altiarchaeota archaeon]
MDTARDGEYSKKGDYHKKLDKNWRYYPIYMAKMGFIEDYLNKTPKSLRILDAGCGEGVLVEKFHKKGYGIIGLDLNYSSDMVKRGDISNMPFKDQEFDLVLCLDILEHLTFDKQEEALEDIKRVLKDDGILLLSIPNLSHFASRISFLFTGNLLRTSEIERHPGDRPINEYMELLRRKGFTIRDRRGIFPTFPVSSLLTYLFPNRVLGLHRLLNTFFAYPNWCFLNIMVCRNDGVLH